MEKTLKISVEEINKSPEKRLEINFSDFIEDIDLNDRVRAYLTASATDYDVNIKGNIRADVVLQCDRCLANYVHNIDIKINEDFTNKAVVPENQRDYQLTEGEFVEELDEKREVDVKDLIYQSIVLDLPNKNLCKADCPGFQDILNNKKEEIQDERLEVFKHFSENNLDEN